MELGVRVTADLVAQALPLNRHIICTQSLEAVCSRSSSPLSVFLSVSPPSLCEVQAGLLWHSNWCCDSFFDSCCMCCQCLADLLQMEVEDYGWLVVDTLRSAPVGSVHDFADAILYVNPSY